jgi:hypothetical protein
MKLTNLYDALDATKKKPTKFARDNDFAMTKAKSKVRKKITFDTKTNQEICKIDSFPCHKKIENFYLENTFNVTQKNAKLHKIGCLQ